jgi:hypothetical protein
MKEKLSSLYTQLNKPIIGRIIRQFGDFSVEKTFDPNMSDSQIFNLLARSHGKGKPHCEKGLTRKPNQMRDS